MKQSFLSLSALAIIFLVGTAFISKDKAHVPEYIQKDYVHSVFNAELEARFETQFSELIPNVSHIDVHQNQSGDYYYVVYGNNAAGDLLVDYFKTTEQEVQTESYNYIEMNARTLGRKVCREATSWPPPSGYFCHANNNGYICGIEVWPGVCFLY